MARILGSMGMYMYINMLYHLYTKTFKAFFFLQRDSKLGLHIELSFKLAQKEKKNCYDFFSLKC